MKKNLIKTLAGVFLIGTLSAGASADITSLRGDNALDADANDIVSMKQAKVQGGIERSWKTQPPSIPHDISKDRITLKNNSCMKCHSAANAEKEKAPRVADSHYLDRDGKDLGKLSSRRWFCDQCHTPQVDASPLVNNQFQGAK